MKPLGKRKCEALKNIRKQVADANGIKYDPTPCTHKGDCLGTCPKCEAEVKYIENELRKKPGGMKNAAAALVGSAITIGSFGLTSCNLIFGPNQVVGDVPYTDSNIINVCPNDSDEEIYMLEGDVADIDTLVDTTAVENDTNTDE